MAKQVEMSENTAIFLTKIAKQKKEPLLTLQTKRESSLTP
jgi:hypothetical protein